MVDNLVIVDFGMGNLHSVASALDYLGAKAKISSNSATVANADTLLLPGVGSFYTAMQRLNETGLADSIREAVLGRGRKILGICLGLQLMATYGEEDGGRGGLGLITGNVTRVPCDSGLKVPHVGFNQVRFASGSRLFAGIEQGLDFYFVHSYRLEVLERPGFTALCDYGGDFVAAYEYETVFATQFHPEKSQTNGLRLLANFLRA